MFSFKKYFYLKKVAWITNWSWNPMREGFRNIIKKLDWFNHKCFSSLDLCLNLTYSFQKLNEVISFKTLSNDMKNSQNTQLDRKTFHNIQCHLACWQSVKLQTRILVNYAWKYPKKCNKIKEPSITYSYIWHINISKFVYWLDIHSVKVWWSYMCCQTQMPLIFVIFFFFYFD